MEQDQAKYLTALLAASYPLHMKAEETGAAYIKFLIDLPFEETNEAIQKLIKTEEFLPSVAKIITQVGVVLGREWTPPALPRPKTDAEVEEINSILGRFWEGREGDRARVERQVAINTGDSTAIEAAAREIAALALEDPPLEPLPAQKRHPRACMGSGAEAVRIEGVLSCPECGTPVS